MTGGLVMKTGALTRRSIQVRPLVIDVLLWGLLCILLSAGFGTANTVKQYPPISLRFDTPVSGKAAFSARQYSIENSGDDPFWPSFWREETASFANEWTTVTADCISFNGDAALVWPAAYLAGAAPGVTDGVGCALSSALAWTLWGSTDVVGQTVDIDDETRVVRGVFEGEEELALLSFRDEDTTQDFHAVELAGGPSDAVSDDAEAYALASGLGKPDAILMGGTLSFLAAAMAALPLFILGVYALALMAGLFRKQSAMLRKCMLFLLLMGCAAGLSGLLDALPAWLMPTRWSDFSFWVSLSQKIGDNVRAFLIATPQLRDVAVKTLLLKQAGIVFLSVGCALSLCFRWQMRRNKSAGSDLFA